ncbi:MULTISPECIES: hypothetical protein [Dyadobacter]|jgi:hypothetical protein|uniref:NUP210 Ig-like domain-containing protein n=1 Tax=Dyadobacter luticola TaxID=1979387 RepID=A0A5R9KMQ4_9BACT|nr:hypothetical protein [Dyadobacter luticola]TLU97316.1 hypothetical protein FEN17_26365 [Dyadobacter luticola]
MKKALLFLLALSFSASIQAARGIIINGAIYNSGETAYIGCGENQNVQINAWTSTTNSPLTILAGITLPSGWTSSYCGNNCSNLTTNASSGGLLKFQYLSTSGEQEWVQVTISRTPLNHLINGPATVCSSTATYTFSGSFYTGSPSWSSSNTSVLTINSSTGVATVHGSGPVTITATVNTACGPFPTSRAVHVGKPTITALQVSTFMCNGAAQELTATISGSPTFRQWAVTSGNASNAYLTDYGNGRCYFNSYVNDCYGLQIQMTNACGSSLDGVTICVDNCGARYTVFPNPANDFIDLKIENFRNSKAMPNQINLYSEGSQASIKALTNEQIAKNINNIGVLRIPVNGVPKGTYYLHILSSDQNGNKIEKVRVAID